MKDGRTVYVYTLSDPRTPDDIRYVGVTFSPKRRLSAHISDCDRIRNRRANWVRSLKRIGLSPVFSVIDTASIISWPDKEVYWIAHYRSLGFDLTNSSDGGFGILNPTQDVRRRISEAQKKRFESMTSEERAAIVKRMRDGMIGMSDEDKEELAKRKSAWTRNNMLKLRESMTPAQVSEFIKKGHETRRSEKGAGYKKRQFCKRGHPMIEGNIVYHSNGKVRRCRVCNDEKVGRWKESRRKKRAHGVGSKRKEMPVEPEIKETR